MSKQVLDEQQMLHLKELGLELHESIFYYFLFLQEADSQWELYYSPTGVNKNDKWYKYIPAFTLQDILDLLPDDIKDSDGYENHLGIDKIDSKWCISYRLSDEFDSMKDFENKELIDAAYEMLCWCLENGYVNNKGNG